MSNLNQLRNTILSAQARGTLGAFDPRAAATLGDLGKIGVKKRVKSAFKGPKGIVRAVVAPVTAGVVVPAAGAAWLASKAAPNSKAVDRVRAALKDEAQKELTVLSVHAAVGAAIGGAILAAPVAASAAGSLATAMGGGTGIASAALTAVAKSTKRPKAVAEDAPFVPSTEVTSAGQPGLTPGQGQMQAQSQAKSGLALAAGGAGAGLLVFGPIGALVGGAAGFLFGRKG